MMEINSKRKKCIITRGMKVLTGSRVTLTKNHLDSFAKVDAHANEASLNMGISIVVTDMLGPQSEDKKAV